jgi:hypothetical protein
MGKRPIVNVSQIGNYGNYGTISDGTSTSETWYIRECCSKRHRDNRTHLANITLCTCIWQFYTWLSETIGRVLTVSCSRLVVCSTICWCHHCKTAVSEFWPCPWKSQLFRGRSPGSYTAFWNLVLFLAQLGMGIDQNVKKGIFPNKSVLFDFKCQWHIHTIDSLEIFKAVFLLEAVVWKWYQQMIDGCHSLV